MLKSYFDITYKWDPENIFEIVQRRFYADLTTEDLAILALIEKFHYAKISNAKLVGNHHYVSKNLEGLFSLNYTQ